MTLYICNYNNYYNRILKKESDIMGYLDSVKYVVPSTNFNPNDGVNTTHVIGAGDYHGVGDYLIALEGNEIRSRWFIIDSIRTRAGQHELTLRRDLLVDFWADVKEAPCFIEKAILKNNDYLIFNNENMSFNQIKKKETLLKDNSQCPWIVGYYSKKTESSFLSGTVNYNDPNDAGFILIDNIEAWEYNATSTPFKANPNEVFYRVYGVNTDNIAGVSNGFIEFNKDGDFYSWQRKLLDFNPGFNFNNNAGEVGRELAPYFQLSKSVLYEFLGDYTTITSEAKFEEFYSLQGKTIKDLATGKYYRVSITINPTIHYTDTVSIKSGSMFQYLSSIVTQENSSTLGGYANANSFEATVSGILFDMALDELENASTTWNMTANKLITEDAPYNIFAIPYGAVSLYKTGEGKLVTSSKALAYNTAVSMITTMGSNLYDMQILPYCPISLPSDYVKRVEVDSDLAYSLILGKNNTPVGFILNVPKASFSVDIFTNINVDNKKISNECDFYKLCSPNWSSEFQFSAAKNGGVSYFNVDCEYKPYQPYIHVGIDFKELYGIDYNDARGLICSGDFSITQISDAWQNYQINNKNFQNIFDRQIQNMEVNNNVARLQDKLTATVGAVSGAVSGAAGGALVGGGYGAIAGALVGGAASAIGGAMDYHIKEKLRNETLDYTKDMFGYQLGNIQALPYTLTKVSSFNNNNKLFPILEYYTCTETEKLALANKIAYNGMTVGVIGKISDYLGNTWSYKDIIAKGYIKAKLIRLEIPGEDYHIVNSIADELNKGVYTL